VAPAERATSAPPDEQPPFIPSPERAPQDRRPRRRWWWALGIILAALCLAVSGVLVGDEVQANQQFDRARASLRSVQHQTTTASEQLTRARNDLSFVSAQVGSDTTALAQDTSELKAAQTALGSAQANVAAQASRITALHACLGGVERALNALAVGRRPRAVSALKAVAKRCSDATAASG